MPKGSTERLLPWQTVAAMTPSDLVYKQLSDSLIEYDSFGERHSVVFVKLIGMNPLI
jgi:hypothetical protein